MTGTLISDRYCRPDDESFMLGRGTNPFLVCFAGIVLLPANARAGKRRDRPAGRAAGTAWPFERV